MLKILNKKYIGFLKPRRRIVDKSGKYVERFEPSRKLLAVIALSCAGFGYYTLKRYANYGKKTVKVSEINTN